MIENLKLEDITLTGNYLIVKPDPNYDFVEIKGQDGNVKIYLSYDPQDDTKHVSISGTVLKTPSELKYYGELLNKELSISQEERSSKMRNTMPYKTNLNVKEGDKVYFNYHNQFDVEIEGRLISIEGEGLCMLMMYDTLYGKQVGDKFVPLNGYVIFKRDQSEREYTLPSGLTIIQTTNLYAGKQGFVVSADEAVSGYIDGGYEDKMKLNEGDRIIINPKFGYRIAYSIHAGDMEDYEIIRRRHILGIFDK